MKITIFYFSGTGNTWWITKQISEKLTEMKHNVKMISIDSYILRDEKYKLKLIEESDIIGIGYPIYNSDIAEPMKLFLEDLPSNLEQTKPVFSYCTQMFVGGNAGVLSKSYLELSDSGKKDFELKWAAHFIMPCNIHLPPIVKVPSKQKIKKIIEGEKKYISKFVTKIASNSPWIEGGFEKIRGMFSLKFPTHKKILEIDNNLCNNCNLCAEICPMDNIIVEEDNYKIRGSCYFCVRCYNFCPKAAIKIKLENTHLELSNGIKQYKGPVKEFNPKKMLQNYI
ncbi:MAG: EFR1 family ferrodoxin [Promethearchaeota archaeon]